MADTGTPKYEVLRQDGAIEIREYAPNLIAAVKVRGARDGAASAGFRVLVDYIFGNNVDQSKISMTAPVEQSQVRDGQKIAMTAPVEQSGGGGFWTVSFVMPSVFTRESLPMPRDDRIVITERAPKRFVVIRFNGRITDSNIAQNETALLRYIKEKSISVTGDAIYAFYDPPFTLPTRRRNEIMFEVVSE